MYEPKTDGKVKFEVSKCLKRFNKEYRKNYTVQDVAEKVGVSRETISRLSSDSSFSLVYAVASCIYDFYPEKNGGNWNFAYFVEYLAWDNHAFLL